ncbi:MAG: hypothetical protein KKD00_03525, partial [Gammaproteobacteria bacterium]|nr:hypothetical protein [Gammaproteobacteria bacterium]
MTEHTSILLCGTGFASCSSDNRFMTIANEGAGQHRIQTARAKALLTRINRAGSAFFYVRNFSLMVTGCLQSKHS